MADASDQIEFELHCKSEINKCIDMVSQEKSDAKFVFIVKVTDDNSVKFYRAGYISQLELTGFPFTIEEILEEMKETMYGESSKG